VCSSDLPPGSLTIDQRSLSQSMRILIFPEQIHANLLERRPDIIAANYRLQKAFHEKESSRLGRLPQFALVTNFTDQNHVRVVPQHRPQPSSEIQADSRTHLHLRDAL